MTYGTRRITVALLLFLICFLGPIFAIVTYLLYRLHPGPDGIMFFVTSTTLVFLLGNFVVAVTLAYWLSGVFVKRPVVR